MFNLFGYSEKCLVKLTSTFGGCQCFSYSVYFFAADTFGFGLVAATVFVAASCFRRFEFSVDLLGDFSSGASYSRLDESSSLSISSGD